MYAIAHEPISKLYSASIFSRSFCITYICYILLIIIPLTLLINIGYSWPQYKRVLITPELNYRGYQSFCLDSSKAYIYDSSFDNDDVSTKTYTTSLSVGRDDNKLYVNGDIQTNSLQSCSFTLYFQIQFQESIRSIVQLPLNFFVQDTTTLYLESANIKGTIQMFSSSPIPQSPVLTLDQRNIVNYGDTFSMSDNFLKNANRNITISANRNYQDYSYALNTTTGFTFTAQFNIMANQYYQQASLLDKIRQFVPYLIYIIIILWLALIKPLIEWMLENRIYTTRVGHQKLKSQ